MITSRDFISFLWVNRFSHRLTPYDCSLWKKFAYCKEIRTRLIQHSENFYPFVLLTTRVLHVEQNTKIRYIKYLTAGDSVIPPATNSAIPSSTLRSGFQPGDTSEAQFSRHSFLLVRHENTPRAHTCARIGILGVLAESPSIVVYSGSWERTATLVLWMLWGVLPVSPPPSYLLSPAPPWPPHKRITWVPKRAKRGSMARER